MKVFGLDHSANKNSNAMLENFKGSYCSYILCKSSIHVYGHIYGCISVHTVLWSWCANSLCMRALDRIAL